MPLPFPQAALLLLGWGGGEESPAQMLSPTGLS